MSSVCKSQGPPYICQKLILTLTSTFISENGRLAFSVAGNYIFNPLSPVALPVSRRSLGDGPLCEIPLHGRLQDPNFIIQDKQCEFSHHKPVRDFMQKKHVFILFLLLLVRKLYFSSMIFFIFQVHLNKQ